MAYLIVGGVPAGINFRPGDAGCLKNNVHIIITTMHGIVRRSPSGIVIFEFPLNGTRRLKKASDIRGGNFSECFDQSLRSGREGEEKFLVRFWTTPMVIEQS